MSSDQILAMQKRSGRLRADGQQDEAARVAHEALQLAIECDGAQSPRVADLLNDLAEIEVDRDYLNLALALTERARFVEAALGESFRGETAARVRIRTLSLAGAIRRAQGDHARAERDLRGAATLSVLEFGDASMEAAEARRNLATLYTCFGRFDEGLRLYMEALGAIVPAHGEASLDAAAVYHDIGSLLHARGDFVSAESSARRAWEIARAGRGDEHPRAVRYAITYAGVLDGLGKDELSEQIYRRSLAIVERVGGPARRDEAKLLHRLARLLAVRGEREEAERHYRRSIEIAERTVGEMATDVVLTRSDLGQLLVEMGRATEALPLLRSAAALLAAQLPAEHRDLAAARERLRLALALAATAGGAADRLSDAAPPCPSSSSSPAAGAGAGTAARSS